MDAGLDPGREAVPEDVAALLWLLGSALLGQETGEEDGPER